MRINMQNRVKEVLEDSIHCRDSDVYLVYEIWSQEIIDNPSTPYLDQVLVNEIDMINIFRMWKDKLISHPSAIMRARRKVQEEHPHTRGKVWEERHNQQERVQEDLGYNVSQD